MAGFPSTLQKAAFPELIRGMSMNEGWPLVSSFTVDWILGDTWFIPAFKPYCLLSVGDSKHIVYVSEPQPREVYTI